MEDGQHTALALARALHPRLGTSSPASLLSQHLLRLVVAALVPKPEPAAALLLSPCGPPLPDLCVLALAAPVGTLLALGSLAASGRAPLQRPAELLGVCRRRLSARLRDVWPDTFASSRRQAALLAAGVVRAVAGPQEPPEALAAVAEHYVRVVVDCELPVDEWREFVATLCAVLDEGHAGATRRALGYLRAAVDAAPSARLALVSPLVADCLVRLAGPSAASAAAPSDSTLRSALELLRRVAPELPEASPVLPRAVEAVLSRAELWFCGPSAPFFRWASARFGAQLAPQLRGIAEAAPRHFLKSADALDLVRALAECAGPAEAALLRERSAELFRALTLCLKLRHDDPALSGACVRCLAALAGRCPGVCEWSLRLLSAAAASASLPESIAAVLALRAVCACADPAARAALASEGVWAELARGCAAEDAALCAASFAAAADVVDATSWIPAGSASVRAVARAALKRLPAARGSEAALGALFRAAGAAGTEAAARFVCASAGEAIDRLLRVFGDPAFSADRRDAVLRALGDVVAVAPATVCCRRVDAILRELRAGPAGGAGAAHCVVSTAAVASSCNANAGDADGPGGLGGCDRGVGLLECFEVLVRRGCGGPPDDGHAQRAPRPSPAAAQQQQHACLFSRKPCDA
eukprot:m51a1_g9808 hypothetical protein (645) ;mRNA; r:1822324-1824922